MMAADPSDPATPATVPATLPAATGFPVSLAGAAVGTLTFQTGANLSATGRPQGGIKGGFRANPAYKSDPAHCQSFYWIQVVSTNAPNLVDGSKQHRSPTTGLFDSIDNGGVNVRLGLPWYGPANIRATKWFGFKSGAEQWDFGVADNPSREAAAVAAPIPLFGAPTHPRLCRPGCQEDHSAENGLVGMVGDGRCRRGSGGRRQPD